MEEQCRRSEPPRLHRFKAQDGQTRRRRQPFHQAAGALRPYLRTVTTALAATTAVCFDIDAHDAIGQTVASAMDPQAVRQVKRLMDGQDASDVAGWGHKVDETFPGMNRLHYQVHDDASGWCGDVEKRVAKCDDNICLVEAIKHFYGKVLAAEGRKVDFPSIDYSKVAKDVKFSDADMVKLLINLLGDLHQPMHVGYSGDDSGKKVQVKFQGKTMSLYDFWDKTISETVRTEEENFWLGGWTQVRSIMSEWEQDKELWKKEGAFKMFERWAAETVKFACETAYTLPSGKKLAGPDAASGPVEIDRSDYMALRSAWLKQILLAGERTAIVLNDILDAKGAAKLVEGQGVKTKADEDDKREKDEWEKQRQEERKKEKKDTGRRPTVAKGPTFQPRILLINGSIAAVVVSIFLLVVNHGPNPAQWTVMLRTLTQEGGGSVGGASSSGPGKRSQ
eukprot:TRINITY_DN112324_c0_g1_i1.p1 TRINITY_DN112324_c0_g1~~TRINITY_DN112324_c0_g1_i1.p1  ORF type:complete len:450 (-),score=131.64 TRINITY_DN112324_c0_g1_i1:41-1390(-)